nr:histidine phosphatase family protein [Pseudoruegeria sp. HB172150]
MIRHAETTGQAPEALLTTSGRAQAQALAPRLRALGACAIHSSPYRRAVETAEPFAASIGAAVDTDDDLRERVLTAEPRDDWREQLRLGFADRQMYLPGGESLAATESRALRALARIAALGRDRPAVVSHGGLIAALLSGIDPAFGPDEMFALANPDLFDLTFSGDRPMTFTRLSLE